MLDYEGLFVKDKVEKVKRARRENDEIEKITIETGKIKEKDSN